MKIKEILKEMPAIVGRHAKTKPVYNPTGALGTHLKAEIEQGSLVSRVYTYPDHTQVPSGQYNSVQELESEIVKFENKFGKITWANTLQRNADKNKFLGFVISYWINEKNQRVIIGKYLHDTKAVSKGHGNQSSNYHHPRRFDANDLSKELGYYSTHANNKSAVAPTTSSTGTSVSTITMLQPANVLDVTKAYDIPGIIQAVESKFGATHPLTKLTQSVASGTKTSPIDTSGISIPHLQKSFTEILHPIALMTGAYLGSSPNLDFTGATINYGANSGALSDSTIELSNGNKVFVSSKFKSGTPPAIGNDFNNLLNNLNPKLKKKYQNEFDILQIIATSPAQPAPGKIGPLAAAVKLNILTQQEAEFIADSLSATATRNAPSSQLPPSTPKRLADIVNSAKGGQRGVMSYYVLVKYAMDNVASIMNNNPNTAILMNAVLGSNFITLSTNSKAMRNNIITLDFTIKLLSIDLPRQVVLTTGTAYHTDHIKNKLQFVIQ